MRLILVLLMLLLFPPTIFAQESSCPNQLRRMDKFLQIVGNARNVAEAQIAALTVENENLRQELEALKTKKESK